MWGKIILCTTAVGVAEFFPKWSGVVGRERGGSLALYVVCTTTRMVDGERTKHVGVSQQCWGRQEASAMKLTARAKILKATRRTSIPTYYKKAREVSTRSKKVTPPPHKHIICHNTRSYRLVSPIKQRRWVMNPIMRSQGRWNPL